MSDYEDRAVEIGAANICDILDDDENNEYVDESRVRLLVQITSIKQKATKSGQQMAFLTVEDVYGSISAMLFPKKLAEYARFIKPDEVIVIDGKISIREDRDPDIIVESIYPPSSVPPKPADNVKRRNSSASQNVDKNEDSGDLYIRIPSLESDEYKRAAAVISEFRGNTRLVIVCADTKKRLAAPQNMWVNTNGVLIDRLCEILGEENVAIKK